MLSLKCVPFRALAVWLCFSALCTSFSAAPLAPSTSKSVALGTHGTQRRLGVASDGHDVGEYTNIILTDTAKAVIKGVGKSVAVAAFQGTSLSAAAAAGATAGLANIATAPYFAAWTFAQKNMDAILDELNAGRVRELLFGMFTAAIVGTGKDQRDRVTGDQPLMSYVLSTLEVSNGLGQRMIDSMSIREIQQLFAMDTISPNEMCRLDQFTRLKPDPSLPFAHMLLKEGKLNYDGFYHLAKAMSYEMDELNWDLSFFQDHFKKYIKGIVAKHFYTGLFDNFKKLTPADLADPKSDYYEMYQLLDTQIIVFANNYDTITSDVQ